MISRDELERIKRSVRPLPESDREARRIDLHKKSEDRISKWTNTLQAFRAKKENWKKDKEDRAEEERLKVDRQEEKIQKELRMDAIRRANELLYAQTDKMKNLRSQQLYSDVLQDRQEQIAEKQMMATWAAHREVAFHKQLVKQLEEAEIKEAQEQKRRQDAHAHIAEIQKEQLEEYKDHYISSLREEKAEGLRTKAKALEDLLEDQQKEAERRRRAREAAEATRVANEHMKVLRDELRRRDELEEEKRKVEAENKDRLVSRRKAQELMRFNEKLAMKQRMIDVATRQLEELKDKDDTREEMQAVEMKEKEDAELERRAEARRREWRAIERSRSLQIKMRADKVAADRALSERMVEHWHARNLVLTAEEREEEAARARANAEQVAALREQMDAKERAAVEARALRLYSEEQTKAVLREDERRFRDFAARELDSYAAETAAGDPGSSSFSAAAAASTGSGLGGGPGGKRVGRNIIPIQRAMLAKDKVVLPVGGFRV